MALTERKRFVANPAKRGRKRNMSDRQAAIFGKTPAARAAARARLGRTNSSHRSGSRPKRSNPGGEIIGFKMRRGNPAERRNMPKSNKAKRKNTPRGYAHKKSHRKNPATRNPHMKHHHRRHHHNPGGVQELTGYVTNAVFVVVGALGSKLGAQALLGTNNTGVVGYAGNAAVGAALWMLARHVMKNQQAASGVIAGTLVEILLRVINDMTPFGQYVSQLGMGDYQMQSFVTPQVLVDPYNSAQIMLPNGWAPQLPPPAPPAAPGGHAAGAPGMGAFYGNTYDGRSDLYGS